MQLKPIRGDYIFEQPKHGILHSVFVLINLWEEFESVVLEQNHRQGQDKVYAELLSRLRFKEKEENILMEDLAFLKSRVLPPENEEATFQIYGKNASVNVVNEQRLDLLPTKLHIIEATHIPAVAKRPDLTPIEKYSLNYTLGDIRKNHGANAILCQFPLKLSWAATSHKVGNDVNIDAK